MGESAILKKMNPGNDFLDQFWDQLPAKKTKREIPLENAISFDHLFEVSSRRVTKSTHFINQKQLRQLSACWGNKNNARDCQDYFGRKVHLRNKHYMKVDQ